VTFDPVKLASGNMASTNEHVVWQADQSYEVVNGTELKPKLDFNSASGHPLVETTSAASVNGAAQIVLHTEFVTITYFWKSYAADLGTYLAEHERSARMAVLGYTGGGGPLIWFASFPATLSNPSNQMVSCLVFYRPANDGYLKLNQAQDMSRLNRFLLSQVPGSGDYKKAEIFMSYKPPPGESPVYGYLRCGFEHALVQSGKQVVMLHPWPSGVAGNDFGEAKGSMVPKLAAWAVRYLWGSEVIGTSGNQPTLRLGRLGLAAFSAGGQAMWPTLSAVGDRVEEVYTFDSNGIAPDNAILWFGQSPTTRCLRMSGGYQIAAHQAVKSGIEKSSGATGRVTAWPSSPDAYKTGTAAWEQALSLLPDVPPQKWQSAVRGSVKYWHQFAVFGGSGALSGQSYVSFLQEFLQASSF